MAISESNKVTVIDRLKQISRNTAMYALKVKKCQLDKLSPKKKTGLDCMTFGLDQINSLNEDMKVSWFNYSYYLMRMIKDDEVDHLATMSYYAAETYILAYFSKDAIKSIRSENQEAFKFLFRDFANLATGETPELANKFYVV